MTKTANQRLKIDFIDDFTIVEFLDDEICQVFCESDDVEEVGGQLDHLVESTRPRRLLLDFSRIEFMASFMQAFLLRLQSRLGRAGGRLKLCGLSDQVEQSFQITNLHRLFAIYPDQPSALDAFDAER